MRLALLLAVVMATGCVSPQLRGSQGDDARELPPGMSASPAREMARKVVSAKEEPNTLIASDRSSCRVTEQKYRETALGERVWCAWSKV